MVDDLKLNLRLNFVPIEKMVYVPDSAKKLCLTLKIPLF